VADLEVDHGRTHALGGADHGPGIGIQQCQICGGIEIEGGAVPAGLAGGGETFEELFHRLSSKPGLFPKHP
jgi:hypothetical protein